MVKRVSTKRRRKEYLGNKDYTWKDYDFIHDFVWVTEETNYFKLCENEHPQAVVEVGARERAE